jgi:hypothetical protein
MFAARVMAVVALAAQGGCGSSGPAASACLVDEDCPPDWYCDGPASGALSCVAAPGGTCRPIDFSIWGTACTDDSDCKAAIYYCSAGLHECALNACQVLGTRPSVCNYGQCPDAGSTDAAGSGEIVECAPGCHAGTRAAFCRSCFCDSCSAAGSN